MGDTGAALDPSTGDMNTVATAIGRMESTDKANLEYLNMLQERGIDAIGALAEAYGVTQARVYDMISKSEIGGGDAADIISHLDGAALFRRHGGAVQDLFRSDLHAGRREGGDRQRRGRALQRGPQRGAPGRRSTPMAAFWGRRWKASARWRGKPGLSGESGGAVPERGAVRRPAGEKTTLFDEGPAPS